MVSLANHAWVSKERYSIKCGSVATAIVTTGHQFNILKGPLTFKIKILAAKRQM